MGPPAPATLRRADARVRAVVLRRAVLLAFLGLLILAAPSGSPAPGSPLVPRPAPGPTAAHALPDGGHHGGGHGGHSVGYPGEGRERAGTLCTHAACDGQPRLNRSGPAERFAGAFGAALLPERLAPAAPGCGAAPAPPAGGAHVEDVRCPQGRSPPPPPGI